MFHLATSTCATLFSGRTSIQAPGRLAPHLNTDNTDKNAAAIRGAAANLVASDDDDDDKLPSAAVCGARGGAGGEVLLAIDYKLSTID